MSNYRPLQAQFCTEMLAELGDTALIEEWKHCQINDAKFLVAPKHIQARAIQFDLVGGSCTRILLLLPETPINNPVEASWNKQWLVLRADYGDEQAPEWTFCYRRGPDDCFQGVYMERGRVNVDEEGNLRIALVSKVLASESESVDVLITVHRGSLCWPYALLDPDRLRDYYAAKDIPKHLAESLERERQARASAHAIYDGYRN